MKRKSVTIEDLVKRMVTMYLPDHAKSFPFLQRVMSNSMVVSFKMHACILFNGERKYKIGDNDSDFETVNEICLLRFPKLKDGYVTFDCFFPKCKGGINLT